MGNEQSRPRTPPEERSARAEKKFNDEVERQVQKLEEEGAATSDQNNKTTSTEPHQSVLCAQAGDRSLHTPPAKGTQTQKTLIRDSRNASKQTDGAKRTKGPVGGPPRTNSAGGGGITGDSSLTVQTATQVDVPSVRHKTIAISNNTASDVQPGSAKSIKRSLQDLHPVRKSTTSKANKTSSESSPTMVNQNEPRIRQERELLPPTWYQELGAKATRMKGDTDVDILLQRLKQQITRTKREHQNHNDLMRLFEEVRNRLHALVFQKVNRQILRTNRMLHNDGGLPALFDERYMGGVPWPYDVRADAHELYNKWSASIFETDLLRGIIRGQPNDKRREQKGHGDSLDKTWSGKVSASYFGPGNLLNGQWWPTQLCALRDGAHGQSQKGIHGDVEEGAYSVLLSDGYSDDEDHGDEVLYCGVDSTDGTVTAETRSMMVNQTTNQPVRLIRTKQCKSNYRPEIGLRYDGLYNVVSWENLDAPTSLRQRHRFKLVRCAGQDPFRAEGPAKRPTVEEMDEYKRDKRLRGFEG